MLALFSNPILTFKIAHTIAAILYKLQMAFTHETTKATSGMHAALADYVSTYLRSAYLNKLCSAQGSDLALM